ncbi:MAG: hypothetical protein IPK97_17905 [Ahniella sp.]|nr:hypothetical protein [Ahniella sp.]
MHRLTYRRTNHNNLHVCAYHEGGTISTLSNGGNRATRPVPHPSRVGATLPAAPVPILSEIVHPHYT